MSHTAKTNEPQHVIGCFQWQPVTRTNEPQHVIGCFQWQPVSSW